MVAMAMAGGWACGSAALGQCAPATLDITDAYVINEESSPELFLVEGQSYRFNCEDLSQFHPLILTTNANGGSFAGQLSAAQVPGYVAGGICSTCGVGDEFTITPGPNTPSSFYYQCHVHAGLGNQITILRRPIISEQPEAEATCAGGMIMLEVAASIPGGGTPTYQWRKGGVNIAGGTSAMLMVHGALAQDSGSYDCVVSNGCASVTSQAAQVSICPADLAGSGGGGQCDGGVDINDLLFFLVNFESGSAAADVDNDGAEPQAPDGGVDVNDLLYFLVRFEGGC